jgi:hypothetical protein
MVAAADEFHKILIAMAKHPVNLRLFAIAHCKDYMPLFPVQFPVHALVTYGAICFLHFNTLLLIRPGCFTYRFHAMASVLFY